MDLCKNNLIFFYFHVFVTFRLKEWTQVKKERESICDTCDLHLKKSVVRFEKAVCYLSSIFASFKC